MKLYSYHRVYQVHNILYAFMMIFYAIIPFGILVYSIHTFSNIIYDFIKEFIIENELKLYAFKQSLKNDTQETEIDFEYKYENNLAYYLFFSNFTLIEFITIEINNIYHEKSL